jgi:HK97 gp10 family phage protein
MRIDADVRQLDVLAGMFAKAGGNVRKPVSNVLKEAAKQVRADGRANVRKRSGKTQRSITYRSRQKGLEYQIGPTWFVGRFLEYGTRKMPAYPFMAPTLDRQQDLPKRVVDAAVRDMTAVTSPQRLI